jgi:hypothetical protein
VTIGGTVVVVEVVPGIDVVLVLLVEEDVVLVEFCGYTLSM